MNIGDRFTRTTTRSYVEHDERHEHALTLLCEIDAVDGRAISWHTVEILDETGAPTTFAPSRPERGEFAWFGWQAAIARGDVQPC